jgi:hypothetical protein
MVGPGPLLQEPSPPCQLLLHNLVLFRIPTPATHSVHTGPWPLCGAKHHLTPTDIVERHARPSAQHSALSRLLPQVKKKYAKERNINVQCNFQTGDNAKRRLFGSGRAHVLKGDGLLLLSECEGLEKLGIHIVRRWRRRSAPVIEL